ncbi:alkaline phosphatase family protein [Mucilaginibacter humi]|uniref:alkaline phosphatase family protein n=1 Tax=Mucilaginibacter humi TaxID=2732510 RepID=UPI00293B933F|nr:alkaline phosphatase family protein [Mucilaginibacter humi]
MAAFFTYLDGKIGKGQYTVFLSADHGAAHNTGFLRDHNVPADVWDESGAAKDLNKVLMDKYKLDKIVLGLTNYQVNLNYAVINRNGLDENAIKADCIKYLQDLPGVAFAIDMQKAATANIPEELRMRIINGYNIEHSGVIQIILKPAWLGGRRVGDVSPTGTSHGTWNPYDTHIPMVFMGWGINHGATSKPTHMTDIAPTVAALLHIQAPNGSIGKSVSEVLKSDNK